MNPATQTYKPPKASPARAVPGNRYFHRLWIGESVSVPGDHSYSIVRHWLVLLVWPSPYWGYHYVI